MVQGTKSLKPPTVFLVSSSMGEGKVIIENLGQYRSRYVLFRRQWWTEKQCLICSLYTQHCIRGFMYVLYSMSVGLTKIVTFVGCCCHPHRQ